MEDFSVVCPVVDIEDVRGVSLVVDIADLSVVCPVVDIKSSISTAADRQQYNLLYLLQDRQH
jgi:tRNA (Thr-GGU) A37 N-methylase